MTISKLLLILSILLQTINTYAKDYDAELLSQQDEIEVLGNKLSKKSTYRIKINNRNGEQYSLVKIPHSKISKIYKIDAHIENSSGQVIRKLSNSEIKEHSAFSGSFYEDAMITEFTLKHNSYPYIIEYSYERKESDFLFIEYWMPILDLGIPTRKASLIVNIPSKYHLKYKSQEVEDPIITSTDKVNTYTWEIESILLGENEVLSPSISMVAPHVKVIPINFHFEKDGCFENWKTYGDWQYDLLEGLNLLPPSEKAKINEIIKGVNDEREKVKCLYHYLQNETRYINISIETGGLKPHPASYVAENKYGDCKALSNYLKSILEYIGIKSYYTKVYAGSPNRPIDLDFPSQQSNHILLMIPQKKDTIWLDCTSDGPFNYLGTFSQNRAALVIDEGNSHFVKTPSLTPCDVLEIRNINIKFPEGGKSTVVFDGIYRGEMFDLILSIEKTNNEKEKSQIINKRILENGFELNHYKVKKYDRDSTFVGLNIETVNRSLYKKYGDEIIVKNIPFQLPPLEKVGEREFSVQIDDPIYKIDTINYSHDTAYRVLNMAQNQTIETKFGMYKISCTKLEGCVQIIKSLLIHAGNYPIDLYPDFYAFIQQIKEAENKPLLILNN